MPNDIRDQPKLEVEVANLDRSTPFCDEALAKEVDLKILYTLMAREEVLEDDKELMQNLLNKYYPLQGAENEHDRMARASNRIKEDSDRASNSPCSEGSKAHKKQSMSTGYVEFGQV